MDTSTALASLSESGLGGRVRGMLRRWTTNIGGSDVEEKLARLQATTNGYGVDPFGLDLEFAKAAIAPVLWLYRSYFRCEVRGAEHIPSGRVLLISNHSGQLPFDGAMIGIASLLEAEPP